MARTRSRPRSCRAWWRVLPLLVPTLLLALAACGPLRGAAPADGPRLTFQERSHEFGQLSASRPSEYRFPFANGGSTPLTIAEVRPEPGSPGG